MEEILKHLSEEKRDKIINSAIEEFSRCPFEKASTNKIVQNAGISKGLLFHYFRSKKELYEKLVVFVINKLTEMISSRIDWDETDIFQRIKELIIMKVEMSKEYPKMFDFILKVLEEKDVKTQKEVYQLYEDYGLNIKTIVSDVFSKNVDFTLFKESSDIELKINIIRWTLEKYSEELLELYRKQNSVANLDLNEMTEKIDEYINILKAAFYRGEEK